MEVEEIDDILNIVLESENERDEHEYKCSLFDMSDEQKIERTTQMIRRLNQGTDGAIYEIGYMDDGYPIGLTRIQYEESIRNLEDIARMADAKITRITRKNIKVNIDDVNIMRKKYFNTSMKECHLPYMKSHEDANVDGTINLIVCEVHITKRLVENDYVDIRIATLGNVDAGKSSCIGVLTRGQLDNGRGLARDKIVNFKHELNSGRTSSVAFNIMGFDAEGRVINDNTIRAISWEEIVKQSSKIVTFVDLAGHEKYSKTTVGGICGITPDYAMVVISAIDGVNHMTKQHLFLCLSQEIPFFIVLTKIDVCPKDRLEATRREIERIFGRSSKKTKKLVYIKNIDNDSGRFGVMTLEEKMNKIEDDIRYVSIQITNNIVPVFNVSNVNGIGIDNLKKFLHRLDKYVCQIESEMKPVIFTISDTFLVTGVGTVVHGLLREGIVKVNENLMLGPFDDGVYKKVRVRSIHVKRTLSSHAIAGQMACFNLYGVRRDEIHNHGMVLIGVKSEQKHIKSFIADVRIVNSSASTINIGSFQTIIHILNCRQTARMKRLVDVYKMKDGTVIDEDKKVILRSGMMARVEFEFIKRPTYFNVGERFIFKEQTIHGFGQVVEITG